MRRQFFIGLMLAPCFLLLMVSARAENYGTFVGEVKTQWLLDGRSMELLDDFRFKAPDGEIWTAKKGAKIDGASIPQAFWHIIGGPFEGLYRNASVIHDYYCDHHMKSWQQTHQVFYFGMRASGVPAYKAKAMYFAVYAFGPRWTDKVVNRMIQISNCLERNGGRCVKTEIINRTVSVISLTEERVAISGDDVDRVDRFERELQQNEFSLEEIEKRAEEERRHASTGSVQLPNKVRVIERKHIEVRP